MKTPQERPKLKKNDQYSATLLDSSGHSSRMDFPYVQLEETDKRFGPIMMLTKSRKYREKEGKILLEGKRLITDAILAGAQMEALYFSRLSTLDDLPLTRSTAKIYKLSYKSLKNWSDTQTPAGLMGIFRKPEQGEMKYLRPSVLPITLICDNIRDPGNMGTLIRSAACVGCTRILVSKGSVDVWEPKVLRSGAGAHFRIPIISNVDWGMMPNYVNDISSVFLADSAPVTEKVDQKRISAAMRMVSELEEEQTLENETVSDNDSDLEDEGKDNLKNKSKESDPRLEAYKILPLKSVPYFDVNFSKQTSVLVIGGETHGLSADAHRLAYNKFGHKVYIPMCDGVDSLNSAVASGIILFEMQRQYILSGSKGQAENIS